MRCLQSFGQNFPSSEEAADAWKVSEKTFRPLKRRHTPAPDRKFAPAPDGKFFQNQETQHEHQQNNKHSLQMCTPSYHESRSVRRAPQGPPAHIARNLNKCQLVTERVARARSPHCFDKGWGAWCQRAMLAEFWEKLSVQRRGSKMLGKFRKKKLPVH